MEAQRVTFNQMKDELTASGAKLPIRVNVYGRVSYSHIRTLIAGEDLKKQIERQTHLGIKNPETKEHYSITINSGVKVQEDPEVPEVVRNYIKGKIGSKGSFTVISKSTFPPRFMMGNGQEQLTYVDGNGEQKTIENAGQLPAELGKGLLVCLGVTIYGSKNGMGVGLDHVVPMEPIKYMQSTISPDETLKKIGLINPDDFPIQEEAPVGTPDTQPQAVNPMAGAQAPIPQAPVQQAPYGQPYAPHGQPVQQPAYGQGYAPQGQPAYTQQGSPFMNPPANDPFFAGQGAPQQGGITYQPQ